MHISCVWVCFTIARNAFIEQQSKVANGAHFYAVKDDGIQLEAHNGPSKKHDDFSKLLAAYSTGGLIYAFRIEQKDSSTIR